MQLQGRPRATAAAAPTRTTAVPTGARASESELKWCSSSTNRCSQKQQLQELSIPGWLYIEMRKARRKAFPCLSRTFGQESCRFFRLQCHKKMHSFSPIWTGFDWSWYKGSLWRGIPSTMKFCKEGLGCPVSARASFVWMLEMSNLKVDNPKLILLWGAPAEEMDNPEDPGLPASTVFSVVLHWHERCLPVDCFIVSFTGVHGPEDAGTWRGISLSSSPRAESQLRLPVHRAEYHVLWRLAVANAPVRQSSAKTSKCK